MWLSENDICYSVKTAKLPDRQIRILAEVNACPVSNIVSILKKNGFVFNEKDHLISIPMATLRDGVSLIEVKNANKEEAMARKSISKEVKQAIIDDFNENHPTYLELSKKYGVSNWTIGDLIRKYQNKEGYNHSPVTPKIISDMSEKKSDGKPVKTALAEPVVEKKTDTVDAVLPKIHHTTIDDLSWLNILDSEALKNIYESVGSAISSRTAELKQLYSVYDYIQTLLKK